VVISEISVHTERQIEEKESKEGGIENSGMCGLLITVYQTVTLTDPMPSDFGDQTGLGL
jgi:hypothetical protein